jgi:hypothetical protein
VTQELTPLLNRLAQELGLDDLALDEDGMCMLQGENGMSLALLAHASGQSMTLAASIYPVQGATRAALCEKLLKMNFLLLETQGSTLSIDEEGQEVVVCRQLTISGQEPDDFVEAVLDFLLVSGQLREQLMALPLAGTGSSDRLAGSWISG